MTTNQSKYPTYEEHQKAWEELAKGIASIRDEVREVDSCEILPCSKKGELIIIGSGIETIGISLGDQKLIEAADKVLFCVADPATIVWLKRLRPDALDLYVLYGENKLRYTTYMQMAEAQLYWVRQGLKVLVAFYGHPGIFVLSTHRAIKIARREGYKAVMKAGVCALDTLCADIGIDPCHPGLQTHEATDALVRQRNLDTSLHVVLWQVGLIGELGFRRQGYLNNDFSYFISWLQKIYGEDYKVTHYIGSRYPTIPPLIEIYHLNEMHEPETQLKITGLSTFYIPPRDAIASNVNVVRDLGLLRKGQTLIKPKNPLREIGLYSPKEMKAFDAFENFRIPTSYKWQLETEASKFLIELRFDTKLQELYEKDPIKALDDRRFSALSDKERGMLATRDSGAIQVACKGGYLRSKETEKFITELLTKRTSSSSLLKKIGSLNKEEAREQLNLWLKERGHQIDWSFLNKSIDYLNRNNLFPWTGVFLEPLKEIVVTIIGNQGRRASSIIYINDIRIKKFVFDNGIIKWNAKSGNPYNGFLRLDVTPKGNRRIMGKIWTNDDLVPANNNFIAQEIDPKRKEFLPLTNQLYNTSDLSKIFGEYAVRTTGRFSQAINKFIISEKGLLMNSKQVSFFSFEKGQLSWQGGEKDCYFGKVTLLIDPIIKSIEFFGESKSAEEDGFYKCYGSSIYQEKSDYFGPQIPEWASAYLAAIVQSNTSKGGLLLWHKWEKHNYTSMVVNKIISRLG